MHKMKFKINGMVCTGCENRIKNVIKNIDGVKKVSADYKTGVVKMVAKDNIGIDIIKEKLETLDYEVVSGELK